MPSWVTRTTWYGPATSAVMYGLMRAVVAKWTDLAGRRLLDLCLAPVGGHLPVLGDGGADGEGGLEVGLVEAGVHPLGVRGLELRVEVDLAVERVDEPVQALAGVRVEQVGVDDQLVLGGEAGAA